MPRGYLLYKGPVEPLRALLGVIDLPLQAGKQVRFGRTQDKNDIVLYHDQLPQQSKTAISRSHAVITCLADGDDGDGDNRAAQYAVVDIGSTNGTFVNGVKLAAQKSKDLKEGDEIVFGGNSGIDAGASPEQYTKDGKGA